MYFILWCLFLSFLLFYSVLLQVSWVRQKDLSIISVGDYIYTPDHRFKPKHTDNTDEWYLHIEYAQKDDAGVYECQVSSEPKMSLSFNLEVVGELMPVPSLVKQSPKQTLRWLDFFVQKECVSLGKFVSSVVSADTTLSWNRVYSTVNWLYMISFPLLSHESSNRSTVSNKGREENLCREWFFSQHDLHHWPDYFSSTFCLLVSEWQCLELSTGGSRRFWSRSTKSSHDKWSSNHNIQIRD
jgi:hypothetical protein